MRKLYLDDYSDTMTIRELADSQGVCTKTAREWCLRQGLDSYKVGNTRRIRKEVLIAWIEAKEAENRLATRQTSINS